MLGKRLADDEGQDDGGISVHLQEPLVRMHSSESELPKKVHMHASIRQLDAAAAAGAAALKGGLLLGAEPTLTGLASKRILPQEMASSGRAPLSLPSNSCTAWVRCVSVFMQVWRLEGWRALEASSWRVCGRSQLTIQGQLA